MKASYWQHRKPLACPKGHIMGWLGSRFWMCGECRRIDLKGKRHQERGVIYVQVTDRTVTTDTEEPSR